MNGLFWTIKNIMKMLWEDKLHRSISTSSLAETVLKL